MSPLPLPPVAEPFQLPFHYGALHHIGVDWLTEAEPVRDLLAKHHPALTAAEFGGRALVSFNYQLYFAQYAFGGGVTQEIELNIIAFPTAEADRVPELTYAQYAQGWDQTKLLGIARIHVLCDNPYAITAGRELYAEPKYPGWFEVDLPSLNAPAGDTWTVHCKAAETDREGALKREDTELASLTVQLDDLTTTPANNTPITGYGTDTQGRALAGPMNVYQPYAWYDLSAPDLADRVRLTVHAPETDLGRDIRALLPDTPAAGAWTYQSPPVAAHNRPYYLRPHLAEQ
ncbi:hypothetical protein [Streptomyces boluensis]|uniref:Acetoacetate decarboxylase n=1 Tax=Streptomyces boluensis TaxID=1775135 RepID=A0A964XPS3_9ACTN|nr:hypothetical protein [Streptomyces boluensis]NBE54878.1 hypothetical protein [Streptomyces boluensis]